jgi:hypothetical protein
MLSCKLTTCFGHTGPSSVINDVHTLATKAHLTKIPPMKYTSLQNTEHKQEDHHDKQYITFHHFQLL